MIVQTILTRRLAAGLGIVLVGLLVCGCGGSEGSIDSSPPNTANSSTAKSSVGDVEILTNKTYDSAELQARYPEWGVRVAKIIYSHDIIPDASSARPGLPVKLQWSEAKIKVWLDRNVPTDFDGYLCLDWEEPFPFLQDVGNAYHYIAVEQMRSLLLRVQVLRPYAKVGYYGLPFNSYWSVYHEIKRGRRAHKYEADQAVIQSILDLSQVLFPSFYESYKNSKRTPNLKINGEMLRAILKVSNGRPVIIYTWDRYHDGSQESYRFERLEAQHYKDMLRNLLVQSFGGDQVDGVVLWGADEYYYTAAFAKDASGSYVNRGVDWDQKRAVFEKEKLPDEDPQSFFDRLSKTTYENTHDVVTK